MDVDAAGMGAKAGAHYPGRPRCLPLASGASHMNDAFRKNYFDPLGLVNLLETLPGNRTA